MERFDITLGGKGYMLAPGSYRRGQDGAILPATTPARLVQREWAGGGLRGVQQERDRFWSSVGLLPARAGQGVGAGPQEAALTAAGLDPFARRYSALAAAGGGATRPYLAAGGALWQVERAGTGPGPDNLGSFTQLGPTQAQACNGLASDGVRLYFGRAGAPFLIWPLGGGAFDTSPTLTFNGLIHHAGSLWGLGSPAEPNRLFRCTGNSTVEGSGWALDSAPRAATLARDGLYVATANAIWRARGGVSGGLFEGEVAPVVFANGAGFGDDFTALADYGGELFTWYAGQVMRHRVTASGGAGLLPTGLVAGGCRGLIAAGGCLIACVTDTPQFPGAQLWAYDGQGWWCLARATDSQHDYWAPLPTAAYFADADLLAFGFGTTNVYGLKLRPRPAQPAFAPAGELTTSLWHGRDPDREKVWLRIGAELVTPGGAGPFVPCTVTLGYTLDGTTWAVAGAATLTGGAARTLSWGLPSGATSKWLGLRYGLGGVDDGAPTLAALWAEYRPLEALTRRRHWTFDVLAADATPARDGVPDPRPGAAIAADLWAAWEAGATLPFRDLDYDLAPTERAVRVAGLEELIAAPADAGRWADSRLRVRLIEV